ncbi:MAG: metallophosphoesterase [Oscillospiraceae bacterium]|nr:metallophosphoesterase [Oscillospiraceae bacterium]
MLRFLHASDLHMDSPFQSLSSEQAALRRKELRDLPGLLCDLAREQDCSLILLSGDLFDTVGGYPETTEALLRAFSGSRAHILIAPGNHDFFTAASPYARMHWPENVHIFRSETPECIRIPEQNACVWGAAFRSESSPPLLEGFHAPQTGEYQLMVLHGDPENPASPYNPISAPQIASSGLDYLALGHIHSRSGLLHAGNTAYAWPGCPMGRGFDETGEKGVYVGELDEAGCRLQFHALPGRRYERVEIPAGEVPLESIESALSGKETKQDCWRIILTGESDPICLADLQDALSHRFFSLSLRDETRPKQSLWAGAGSDTLKGILLRNLRSRCSEAPEEERRILELAARYARAALEGREVPEV